MLNKATLDGYIGWNTGNATDDISGEKITGANHERMVK